MREETYFKESMADVNLKKNAMNSLARSVAIKGEVTTG